MGSTYTMMGSLYDVYNAGSKILTGGTLQPTQALNLLCGVGSFWCAALALNMCAYEVSPHYGQKRNRFTSEIKRLRDLSMHQ